MPPLGIEPMSLALEGGFLTTGPQGSPLVTIYRQMFTMKISLTPALLKEAKGVINTRAQNCSYPHQLASFKSPPRPWGGFKCVTVVFKSFSPCNLSSDGNVETAALVELRVGPRHLI